MSHSYPFDGGLSLPSNTARVQSATALFGAQAMRPTTVLACALTMKKARPSL